ncbi:MAG: hypothetical protein PGN26_01790 [Xylophilus ampelinus]
MGWEDRDGMRKRRPVEIDFRPPRRRGSFGWVVAVMSCTALIGLYFAAGRCLDHRATQEDAQRRAQAAASSVEPPVDQRRESGYSRNAVDRPSNNAPASAAGRPATVHTFIKCVDPHGRTNYSDDRCGVGERTSRLEICSDVNVADAERVPLPSPSAVAAQVNVTTAPIGAMQLYAADSRNVCVALEQSIAAYDAQALQSQSAQTQDCISARRKEVRDRQFRSRC